MSNECGKEGGGGRGGAEKSKGESNIGAVVGLIKGTHLQFGGGGGGHKCISRHQQRDTTTDRADVVQWLVLTGQTDADLAAVVGPA